MKSIILCVFFSLTFIQYSFCQFNFSGSFDYYPGGYYEEHKFVHQNTLIAPFKYGDFGVNVSAGYRYGFAMVYFNQSVYMDWINKCASFKPNYAEWKVGIDARVVKGVSINIEHMCGHPIINDLFNPQFSTKRGSYNRISVKYSYN